MKNIYIILTLLLCISVSNAQDIDRSIRPASAPAKAIEIKDAKTFTLANGLKVFVVEDHKTPIVYYSINLDVKPSLEGNKAGMQDLFNKVFGTATTTRSKEQINKDGDLIGARLSTGGWGGYVTFLKKYEPQALELLSDVLLNPVFNQSELDLNVTKQKSELAMIGDDPEEINKRVSSHLTYGDKFPNGEVCTLQTIDNIKINDLQKFYSSYFAPNVSRLVIVGDITEAEAKTYAEKYFGKWKRKTVINATYTIPKKPSALKVAMVDKPGAVQSIIDISYPIKYNVGVPDEAAASLMTYILGGGASGRLFQNLREKHHYTYGVYSSLERGELIGRFSLGGGAPVKAAATDSSITEILTEMKTIINTPISAEELKSAKAFMAGSFGRNLENATTIARFAINIDKYKLPKDYYKNYLKRLDAVTIADVQAAAKKYIKPDSAWIVVAGDKSYAEGLKKFASDGKVQFYNIDGIPVEAPTSQATNISADNIFNNYISAIGGTEAVEKIEDCKMLAEINAMGQKIEMTNLFKKPNYYMVDIMAGGMSVQKILFNGKSVKMSGMQGSKEFSEGDEFEMTKASAAICPEMNYTKDGYATEVKGIEKVNGNDAYVVSIKKGNNTILNFYDKESGLKVKSTTILTTEKGENQQTNEISDYRVVNGVKFPFAMKQSMGGMVMDCTVKSVECNTGIKDTDFN